MNIEDLKEKAVQINDLYKIKNLAESKKESTNEDVVLQFVSDVGDLSRYIIKKQRGDDVENFKETIGRELSECLAHVLVLSEKYGVNLEESFMKEFNRLNSELS